MQILQISDNDLGLDIRADAGEEAHVALDPAAWSALQRGATSDYPGMALGAWCGPRDNQPREHLQALLKELDRYSHPDLRHWLGASTEPLGLACPPSPVPWEWLTGAAGRHLWQMRPVLRQFSQEAERPPAALSKDRTRILACLDPDGTLKRMRPNLTALKTAHVELLEGPQASLANLARELNAQSYDVLLLTCWLRWNPRQRRVALALADGEARRERLQEVLLSGLPPVVILGAFWPAWSHYPAELSEALTELAELCGRLGSRLVLTNLWPFPEWPTQIAEMLSGALNGRTLLQALQRVRLQHAQLSPGPWMGEWSWLVWGQEDLSLPGQATAGTKVSAIRPTHALVVEEGKEVGKRFELVLSKGRVLHLGRPGLKGVDVNLPSDRLENRTASLSRGEGGLILQNLTDQAELVCVNGLPVSRDCQVLNGDRLRLGDWVLALSEIGARPGAAPRSSGVLKAVRWDLPTPPPSPTMPLSTTATTLGRSTECQIVVPDGSVSRVHAAFKWRGEACFLSALGSNPVVVNGVVLEGERELESGDTILVSEAVELVYLWGGDE